jgi:hypothetical protein
MSVRTGRLALQDVALASQVLWATVHGITSLLIHHPHFPWTEREELIDALIDAAVGGLERA